MSQMDQLCIYCQRPPQAFQVVNREVICSLCIGEETTILRAEDVEPPKKTFIELAQELERTRRIPKGVPIRQEVLDILQQCFVKEKVIFIPKHLGILPNQLYQQVDTALSWIGGKWNRKAGGHLFEGGEDPQALLNLLLETGEMPRGNPTGYYPTPAGLAARMASKIPATTRILQILEPSAGTGSIARAIQARCYQERILAELHCCELLPTFRERLRTQGFYVIDEPDFLRYHPEPQYDVILMNPPFSLESDRFAYVAHIEHAWSLLASGGLLASIAPGGFAFREDWRIRRLRGQVEQMGHWEELPDGSFWASGTGVRTVLIEMRKG